MGSSSRSRRNFQKIFSSLIFETCNLEDTRDINGLAILSVILCFVIIYSKYHKYVISLVILRLNVNPVNKSNNLFDISSSLPRRVYLKRNH